MSEEFDFTHKERREARGFEPPPWEKDAFDELKRKRAEEQEAEVAPADTAAASQGQPTAIPPEVAGTDAGAAPEGVAGIAEPLNDDGLEWLEAVQESAATTAQAAAGTPARPAGAVDEAKVAYMLAELAAQEPDTRRSLGTLALWSAAVLGCAGLVFVVWGVVALAGSGTTGRVGAIGGSLFFLVGGAATGAAIWLAVRTLRQRGVL